MIALNLLLAFLLLVAVVGVAGLYRLVQLVERFAVKYGVDVSVNEKGAGQ